MRKVHPQVSSPQTDPILQLCIELFFCFLVSSGVKAVARIPTPPPGDEFVRTGSAGKKRMLQHTVALCCRIL